MMIKIKYRKIDGFIFRRVYLKEYFYSLVETETEGVAEGMFNLNISDSYTYDYNTGICTKVDLPLVVDTSNLQGV